MQSTVAFLRWVFEHPGQPLVLISGNRSLPPFQRLGLPESKILRHRVEDRRGPLPQDQVHLLPVHDAARLLAARTDVVGALVRGGYLRGVSDNGRLAMASVSRHSVDEFLGSYGPTGQLAAIHGVRFKVMTRQLVERGLAPVLLNVPSQPLQALWRKADLQTAGFRGSAGDA